MARVAGSRTPALYVYLKARAGIEGQNYLPRGRAFSRALPKSLRVPQLSHPNRLFDDMETLPLRRHLPRWVENRYVHIALSHDPRTAAPGYLREVDPYYLGLAHAALLGMPQGELGSPEELQRAEYEYMRWTQRPEVYVWAYDPKTHLPRKPPTDPKYLPGTPYDTLRFTNVQATLKQARMGLEALGIAPQDAGDPNKRLDAMLEKVYSLHEPQIAGHFDWSSVRYLPLKVPTFLAPSTREPTRVRRKLKKRKRKKSKKSKALPGKTGRQLTAELRARKAAKE